MGKAYMTYSAIRDAMEAYENKTGGAPNREEEAQRNSLLAYYEFGVRGLFFPQLFPVLVNKSRI